MTQREFNMAIANNEITDEVIEMAKANIEALDNKNANRKKTVNSKREAEIAPIREAIVNFLKTKEAFIPCSEVAKEVEISTSKATPILKAIDGIVIGELKVNGRTVKGYKLA